MPLTDECDWATALYGHVWNRGDTMSASADGLVSDEDALAVVRSGDEAAFARLVQRHRRELHVHCYRMTASFDEAEDLVQETFLRAWSRRETFEAHEGGRLFRAWLYRIATNACLDAARKQRRRVPSVSRAVGEVPWIQPYPDRLLDEIVADPTAPDDGDPGVRAVTRESIEFAFLAIIQLLPPRQRAVLLLRDVLGWPADRTASMLETTVPSANSALQRARATLEQHRSSADVGRPVKEPTPEDLALLAKFIDAHERSDPDAAIAVAREDIRISMPPQPHVFEGIRQIGPLLRGACSRVPARVVAAAAHERQPHAGRRVLPGVGGRHSPRGVQVRLAPGRGRQDRRDHHVRRRVLRRLRPPAPPSRLSRPGSTPRSSRDLPESCACPHRRATTATTGSRPGSSIGAIRRPTRSSTDRTGFVTHIDDEAIAAVSDLYEELAIEGDVLDLMSSWVSHFRAAPRRLVAVGMNGDELASNPTRPTGSCRTSTTGPCLPFDDGPFDERCAACRSTTSSARSRCSPRWAGCSGRAGGSWSRSRTGAFPPRPIRGWLTTSDDGHVAIVEEYFRRAGGFDDPVAELRTPPGHPATRCGACRRGLGNDLATTIRGTCVNNPIGPLLAADEGLNHQISETFAAVGTTDPAWTEKVCAMAAKKDGSLQLGFGLGKYLNRNVLDGYAAVSRDVEQLTVRASRRLYPDPERLKAGPIRYEILEPMKRIRFALDPNDTQPIAFDWVFEAKVPPVTEDRSVNPTAMAYRPAIDLVRYHQIGIASGWVEIDGQRQEIDPDEWVSTRDHSWGIRNEWAFPAGCRHVQPARPHELPHDLEPSLMADPDGTNWGLHLHLIAIDGFGHRSTTVIGSIEHADGSIERMADIDTDLRYDPTNRRLRGGVITATLADGSNRTFEIAVPTETGVHLGLGLYFGWQGHHHGEFRGELNVEGERIADCSDPEVARSVHQIRDTFIRVRDLDTGAVGWGNCQPMIVGDFPELGLPKASSFV